MGVPFEMLKSKEFCGSWIQDSGASGGHSTNWLEAATNIREPGSASIGHSGDVTKASNTIDVPGIVVQKDGSCGTTCGGMTATLIEVSYCASANHHNFNLLRVIVKHYQTVSTEFAFARRLSEPLVAQSNLSISCLLS